MTATIHECPPIVFSPIFYTATAVIYTFHKKET